MTYCILDKDPGTIITLTVFHLVATVGSFIATFLLGLFLKLWIQIDYLTLIYIALVVPGLLTIWIIVESVINILTTPARVEITETEIRFSSILKKNKRIFSKDNLEEIIDRSIRGTPTGLAIYSDTECWTLHKVPREIITEFANRNGISLRMRDVE